MPGNDPTALADLRDKYGQEAGNAEALIEANNLRFTPELRKSSLKTVDDKATEDLDAEKLAKAVGVDEDRILGYAVRGKHIVYVVESESGRPLKGVLTRDLKAVDVGDDDSEEAKEAAAQAEQFDERAKAHAKGESKSDSDK